MEVRFKSQGGQNTQSLNTNTNNSTNNFNDIDTSNRKTVPLKFEESSKGSDSKNYDEKAVKKAVDKLNKLMEDSNTHLEYAIHDVFKDIMITVVDNDTKQVISEIPPKRILDMVAKLCEIAGVLIDKKA